MRSVVSRPNVGAGAWRAQGRIRRIIDLAQGGRQIGLLSCEYVRIIGMFWVDGRAEPRLHPD